MDPRIEEKIELLLLSCIIIFQVAEFFGVLPGDLEYVEKIISLVALGYLFVKVSLSTVLFGYKKPRFDLVIILSYFLFIVKDMVGYANARIEEVAVFEKVFSFLVTNSLLIEKYSFYLAGILLLFISLYMALKFEIREPSFMAVLHETGAPSKKIRRFITLFLVLVAFFIVVFNLAMEWLAIALDTPLVIAGILFYLFVVVRFHTKFNTKHFIYKIGHIGEEFYENFIQMFHYKETLYLGVMGLLALHLLTDVGNFILPYIIGLKDELYFGNLGPGHTPIIQLLTQDLPSAHGIGAVSLVITYILNIIAMLFLLLLPTFAWYRFFKGRPLQISRTPLALVFSSLLCFALTPAFFIRKISIKGLAGVDIMTQSILTSSSIIDLLIKNRITAIMLVSSISIVLGLVVWVLEFNKKIENDVFIIAALVGLVFFGFYIWYYFISLYQYYIDSIIFLLKSSEFLIPFYFILFAMVTVLFYVGGYFFFVYEIFKKHFLREEIFR